MLDQSANGEITIYTSTLSHVEVAFAKSEQKSRTLSPEIESRINSLWADENVVTSVEFQPDIALIARRLMRDGLINGWSLKPPDAIHLATAKWLSDAGFNVDEFHTYDTKLPRYAYMVGIDIHEPRTGQPRLA